MSLKEQSRLRHELKDLLGDLVGKSVRYENLEVLPFGIQQRKVDVVDIIYDKFWMGRLRNFIKNSTEPNRNITVFHTPDFRLYYNNRGIKVIRFKTTPLIKAFDEWIDGHTSKIDLCKDELYTNKDVVMARAYAFRQHDIECNHWYDKKLGLPYSYHLQMVADIGEKFKHLLPKELQTRAIIGCYLHDIVEDCRHTFNDVKKVFGEEVATDACRMCNNVSGHTRDDRANQWYYDKLNESIVTVFIKFCDRIANMEIGMLNNSSMYRKYAREMDGFLSKLDEYRELDPMRVHLYKLKEIAE